MRTHAFAEARREVESWFTGRAYEWRPFVDWEALAYAPTAQLQRILAGVPPIDCLRRTP